MRSVPKATPVILTDGERAELEGVARSRKSQHRMRQRAQIVLLAADGLATRAIARRVGCTVGTASKWRVRYATDRLAGLNETGKRGAEPKYTATTGRRILAVLDGPPPSGCGRWTAPLIAKALGDVHEQYVWRFLRAQKIDLAGRKSWCVSTDPEFAAKAAEIVGLYLDPPEGALVVAVDEKPHIQALERAQGYLKLPNGRAMSGQAHDYTRHGTSTLFAALDIANGEVMARHYQRRRRVEFLDFMNQVVAAHPAREIHVILDNLNTHKPKRDAWLSRHKNVHFHFTPTHASWLNQIECWFSILGGQSLQGASFTGVAHLRKHIDAFVARYNQTARPFAWSKSPVHQKRLKPRFADL
jgi:transposase